MTGETIRAAALWPRPWEGEPQAGGAVRIEGGRIAGVDPAPPEGDRVLLPGLVNAHDHGRGLRPAAHGVADAPLEEWLWGLHGLPGADPYTVAAAAFGRMALSGVTSVVHCHVQATSDPVAEARAVARAASDVGLRLAFVVPVIDRNLAGYDGGAAARAALGPLAEAMDAALALPPVEEQIAAVDAIAAAIDGPLVATQYGPPALHWLSPGPLSELGARAAETGRRVHVHLLETALQREWCDRHHPEGVHRAFAEAGLLNDRLTVAHGVWLREAEARALAGAGAVLALNTSSNLRLRSGLPDGALLARAGLALGLGLDGLALDDDEDLFREMRLATLLHAPRGVSGEGLPEAAVRRAAFSEGARAMGGRPAPGLAAGAPADLVALSLEALAPDRGGAPTAALLAARWRREAVREVWVGGRRIVEDGRLTGVDLDAAEAALRASARAAPPPPAWIAPARRSARAALAPGLPA